MNNFDYDSQFKIFADNLYSISQKFHQQANNPEFDVEQQMIWAISAKLALEIALSAQAISLQHQGTKQ